MRWPWLLGLLLLTACTRPTPVVAPSPVPDPPAPAAENPAPQAPATPVPPPAPAWRKAFDSGSAGVFYAAPDGSGFILSERDGSLHLVRAADVRTEALPTRTISIQVGGEQVQATVAETPYGPMLAGEGKAGFRERSPDLALSPDGRYLAIARHGLWVADVQAGTVRRLGAEPEPAPPNLIKHQPWVWATYPEWSADGGWIEFYSSRLRPGRLARWRVPADGGVEALVNQADAGPYWGVTQPDGHIVQVDGATLRVMPPDRGNPGPVPKPRIVAADVPSPHSLSPDGRWVIGLNGSKSELRIYEVTSGQRRAVALPLGAWPEMSPLWHGDQALFRTRPLSFDGPAFLSILDLRAGTLHHYTPPEPTAGDVVPLGWTGDGQPIVRLLPRSEYLAADPAGARTAPAGVWLLNPAAYQPPPPGTPTLLRVARLNGPGPNWQQVAGAKPVTGGQQTATSLSAVSLLFDQPVRADWLQREVQVSGAATLETHGGPLGMAIVRLNGTQPSARIQAPHFDFDLQLRIEPAPKTGQSPPVYTGPAPTLVAVVDSKDRVLADMPTDLTTATATATEITATVWDFAGDWPRLLERRLNLTTRVWTDLPAATADPAAAGLLPFVRRQSRLAGIAETRWLGRSGGYLYAGDLVVRSESGAEIRRMAGLRSYWPFHTVGSADLAWSPDGRRVALQLPEGPESQALWLAEVEAGTLTQLAGGLKTGSVVWSPDGRYVAVGPQVVATASGQVVVTLSGALHLRWSPDSRRILFARAAWQEVHAHDLQTGADLSLGAGLPVGWDSQGHPLVVRWAERARRFVPQGL